MMLSDPFSIKEVVERAGAEWVGLQASLSTYMPPSVVFINTRTKHQLSIYYNPEHDFETTLQTIKTAILKDDG